MNWKRIIVAFVLGAAIGFLWGALGHAQGRCARIVHERTSSAGVCIPARPYNRFRPERPLSYCRYAVDPCRYGPSECCTRY